MEVKDSVSGSINQNITKNGVIEIMGSSLKIDGQDASNGVFFEDTGGTVTKVATIVSNNPSKLIVMVPDLANGNYTLKVTTQYSTGRLLNNPRTGVFGKKLVVA